MQYDMVFEGGGAKGMVFVGAMQEFTARGHSHGRLLGTSAGAITATLLAAGYTDQEMLTALAEQVEGKSVFTAFMGLPDPLPAETLEKGALSKILAEIDLPLIPNSIESTIDAFILKWMARNPLGRHLLSFIERGGWYSADAFLIWITAKLDSGTFNDQPRNFSQMTLEQFYQATKKDLSLVAANVSKGMKLVLNHRTAPQLPVAWAVRMSMSIPLLWQEVIWQPAWGTYLGQELTGDTIVDGGLISNFPIELFISDEKPIQEVMGEKLHDNVLGCLIDDAIPVTGAPPLPGKTTQPTNANAIEINELVTVQRVLNLVNTMLEANDKAVITAFENLVCRLPAGGYGTTEFDMTEERRNFLVEAGRAAMKQYLDRAEAAQPVSFSFGFDEGPSNTEIANQVARKMLRRTEFNKPSDI